MDGQGSLLIADLHNFRVRRLVPPLPGFSAGDLTLAAEDGSELYAFDPAGRHLRTLHALTGATRATFTYDSAGRLSTLTDGDGNVTTIERDAQGSPTAILVPFGQRTVLTLDANGYLASVTDPAGNATAFTSSPAGLLTTMTTPRGPRYEFTYDALGRLTQDDDPAGGSQTLARTQTGSTVTTTLTTGLTRTSTYLVVQPSRLMLRLRCPRPSDPGRRPGRDQPRVSPSRPIRPRSLRPRQDSPCWPSPPRA